jgi:hypothetical protein
MCAKGDPGRQKGFGGGGITWTWTRMIEWIWMNLYFSPPIVTFLPIPLSPLIPHNNNLRDGKNNTTANGIGVLLACANSNQIQLAH